MPSRGLRRRADLSGAKGVIGRIGRPEPAVLVVAADTAGSAEDGCEPSGETCTLTRARTKWARIGLSGICSFSVR